MYQSLYRKYRPKNFDEIVGQEKVVEVIKNQIKENKISHAYLFTGVRGTGKTSIAKIFAKTINCLDNQNGNPCMVCKNCKYADENSVDIIEMDAASNNSVDDIRMIKDEINFLPTQLKYKVYIIDEVHMLSIGAFNALLKTLEEPPAHAKFILATTDPHKIPATIISRCQRFEFLRITEEQIACQLEKISRLENIDIEKDAIKQISYLANGSLRDAISILESVSNIKGLITKNEIRKVVGIPDTLKVIDAFKSMIIGDVDTLLSISEEILSEGKEPINYLTDLISVSEAIYIGNEKAMSMYNKEEKEKIHKLKGIDRLELYKIIKELLDINANLKYAENKKVMLTAHLIKIGESNKTNKYLPKTKDVYEACDIQNKENIEKAKNVEKIVDIIDNIKAEEVKEGIKEKPKEEIKGQILDVLEVRKRFLKKGETQIFVSLSNAYLEAKGSKVYINLKGETINDNLLILDNKETKTKIEQELSELLNKKVEVEYII